MLSNWISGTGGNYFDIAWQAVLVGDVQAKFRRDPIYMSVLEHVDKGLGDKYLSLIRDARLLDILRNSAAADLVGDPLRAEFNGIMLSPTTVRYVKVLQDLLDYFPQFNDFKSVVEIGVGYGGQSRVIQELCKREGSALELYTLLDLLPVTLLAQSYLDNFDLYARTIATTKTTLARDARYDLVISNYAFSELNRGLQEEYMRNVVSRSGCGYLTMNSGIPGISAWGQDSYEVGELLQLPNAVIVDEQPLTGTYNYVLVFGDHSVRNGVPLDEFLARFPSGI